MWLTRCVFALAQATACQLAASLLGQEVNSGLGMASILPCVLCRSPSGPHTACAGWSGNQRLPIWEGWGCWTCNRRWV
jgi:hypothetical protein